MELVVRATVVFWVIWLIARGLGKRELSEMSPFELILLVVIGDLVQQGVTQEDYSITGSVIAVTTFTFWVLVLRAITYRFGSARRMLDGQPVVVVRDGALCEEAMRYERLTEDDVKEAARDQGIKSLDEVTYGVLEPDGRINFLLRDRTDLPGADDRNLG
jgi:uncharacterized membrane protein YcaP (DUF421 family)